MFPMPIEKRSQSVQVTYKVVLWVSLVVWLIPLLAVALTSVRTLEDITEGNYWGWPSGFNLIQNYVGVFTESAMSRFMANSVMITLPTMFGTIVLATMSGFALAQYRLPGYVLGVFLILPVFLFINAIGMNVVGGLIAILILAALAIIMWRMRVRGEIALFAMFIAGNFIPFQILMIPVRELTRDMGMYDTIWGLVMFHVAFQTGFATLFMRNFIKGLPYELIEAARVEGANEFQIFWNVVLPLVRPAIAAMAVLIFTFIWNDYFWALVLVQTEQAQPITAGLQALKGQWVARWHLISAGAIVAALPPVAMFFLMQKHFIAGLTLGATKG